MRQRRPSGVGQQRNSGETYVDEAGYGLMYRTARGERGIVDVSPTSLPVFVGVWIPATRCPAQPMLHYLLGVIPGDSHPETITRGQSVQ